MVEMVVEEIVEEVQKCVCQMHEWKKSIYRTVNRGVGYKSAGSRKNDEVSLFGRRYHDWCYKVFEHSANEI